MAPITRAKKKAEAQAQTPASDQGRSIPPPTPKPANKRVSLVQVQDESPDRRISGGSFRPQVEQSPLSSIHIINGEEYIEIDESDSDNMSVDSTEKNDLASDGESEDEQCRKRCPWCATFCEGTCEGNPDGCVSCFDDAKMTPYGYDYDPWSPEDFVEKRRVCASKRCKCNCHLYVKQNLEQQWIDSSDVSDYFDNTVPFAPRVKAKGPFNFTGLPDSVRLRILRFALMAEGTYKQRFHHGKIHKNILLVSRDVTLQAQHLVYAVNELIIPSAHLFCRATTLLRSPDFCYVTRIRVDLYESYELTSDYTRHLFRRLSNMHIVSLSLYIYGLVRPFDFSLNHKSPSPFITLLLTTFKHLRKFKIRIGCANLSEDRKDRIDTKLREKLTMPDDKAGCKRCVDELNRIVEEARVEKVWGLKKCGRSKEDVQKAMIMGTRNWLPYLEAQREQKRKAEMGFTIELPEWVFSVSFSGPFSDLNLDKLIADNDLWLGSSLKTFRLTMLGSHLHNLSPMDLGVIPTL
ncbi:MAG: hypothetical protein MMC33_005258 [Icmadophila ericetorum]|nr:hypothetical protein [Icmadophila ericetorum]